jgi:DnaJ-class molecular chaperone
MRAVSNHYDILGIPIGASIDHIKDSYRLATRKTLITDVAYRKLTTQEKRREYDDWTVEAPKSEIQSPLEGTDAKGLGQPRARTMFLWHSSES